MFAELGHEMLAGLGRTWRWDEPAQKYERRSPGDDHYGATPHADLLGAHIHVGHRDVLSGFGGDSGLRGQPTAPPVDRAARMGSGTGQIQPGNRSCVAAELAGRAVGA